jgi:hypothetical protein
MTLGRSDGARTVAMLKIRRQTGTRTLRLMEPNGLLISASH